MIANPKINGVMWLTSPENESMAIGLNKKQQWKYHLCGGNCVLSRNNVTLVLRKEKFEKNFSVQDEPF